MALLKVLWAQQFLINKALHSKSQNHIVLTNVHEEEEEEEKERKKRGYSTNKDITHIEEITSQQYVLASGFSFFFFHFFFVIKWEFKE